MGDQLTKQQIQEEYSKTVALMGERIYRFFLPLIEVSEDLKHLLILNKEMGKLVQAERDKEPKPV